MTHLSLLTSSWALLHQVFCVLEGVPKDLPNYFVDRPLVNLPDFRLSSPALHSCCWLQALILWSLSPLFTFIYSTNSYEVWCARQWGCRPQEASDGFIYPVSSTEVSPSIGSPFPLAAGYLHLDASRYNVLSQHALPIFPGLVSAASIHILRSKMFGSRTSPTSSFSDKNPWCALFIFYIVKERGKNKQNFLEESLGYLILSKKGFMVVHRQKH